MNSVVWRPVMTAALVGMSVVFVALALDRAPAGILSGIAGVALLIPFPGYALAGALFPGRRLDRAERLAVVLGLGLSCAILIGIALSATPAGMVGASWNTALTAVTLAGLAVGAVRSVLAAWNDPAGAGRRPGPDETAPEAPVAPGDGATGVPAEAAGARPVRLRLEQAAMLAAAALITVAAIGVARAGEAGQPHPGTSQLWLLPGDRMTVTLGVADHEGRAMRYTVRLLVDGRPFGEAQAVSLDDGETWERSVALPAGTTGLVEAQLFREGDVEPYRRVAVAAGPDA
jgi:hypothetical protein